jgi:hypothetical protein
MAPGDTEREFKGPLGESRIGDVRQNSRGDGVSYSPTRVIQLSLLELSTGWPFRHPHPSST